MCWGTPTKRMMDDDSAPLTARGRLLPLCLLALAVGIGLGLVMRRASGRGVASEEPEVAVTEKAGTREPTAQRENLRSKDSVNDILGDSSATQFGRLALWLLDASSDELEEMFRGLLEQRGASQRLFLLLFERWAQLDPQRAIEASKGTDHAGLAWLAWGKCESELALAEAVKLGSEEISMTLYGIGEVNPELAMQLMEKYPEAIPYFGVEGIADGLRQTDPARAVEYARGIGVQFSEHMKDWGHRDPRGFLQWCAKNEVGHALSEGTMLALQTIAREHPERVKELVATLPTGMLRKELLNSGVSALVRVDLEQAIALAETVTGETMRRDLYAKIGRELAAIDPARSLELLRETEALGYTLRPRHFDAPGGGGSQGYAPVVYWLQGLADRMPGETIAAMREIEVLQNPRIEQRAGAVWMDQDREEFTAWVEAEPASPQRDAHLGTLVGRMMTADAPDYPAMMDWSASIQNESARGSSIWNVLGRWVNQGSRAEAARYFASPDAPAAAVETWNRFTEQNPEP